MASQKQERLTTNEATIMVLQPPMKCSRCDRLTDLGELSPTDGGSFILTPRCHEHGYLDTCGEAEELRSVERYVIGSYGGGHVEKVMACELDEVPGYLPWEDFDPRRDFQDLAWRVAFVGEDRQACTLYVVFSSISGCLFELYSAPEGSEQH